MLDDLHSAFTKVRLASLKAQYVNPFPPLPLPCPFSPLQRSYICCVSPPLGKGQLELIQNTRLTRLSDSVRASKKSPKPCLVRRQTSTFTVVSSKGARRFVVNRNTVVCIV